MLRHVATKLARAVLCITVFAATFAVGRAVMEPTLRVSPVEATPRAVTTPRAIVLADRHDCWSGEAPADMAGELPGHVVVTVDGEARYAGPRMVGKALEQIFEDVDHGLTVHAFCR